MRSAAPQPKQKTSRGRVSARAHRLAARFGLDRRGASAVEFALIAVPFLMLLFGVLELAFIFMMNVSLSNITVSMARKIRLGGVQAPGVTVGATTGTQMDLNDFKTAVCSQIYLVANATCMSALQVDVRTLTSFSAGGPASPVSGSTFNSSNFCYYSGGSGSIVEMRVYYLWAPLNPLLNVLASITTATGAGSGNWVLLSSTQVFKNESIPGLSNTSNSC